MEEIIVNVEFEGGGFGNISEVQVVPADIAWEDFDLMLKVYADQEQILVKYRDEDEDDISINSEEELREAFKVAKKSNNTLRLKVVCGDCLPSPPEGIQCGGIKVKANVKHQFVAMTTVPDGQSSTAVTGSTQTKPTTVQQQGVAMQPEREKMERDGDDCKIEEHKDVKKSVPRKIKGKTNKETGEKCAHEQKCSKRGNPDYGSPSGTAFGTVVGGAKLSPRHRLRPCPRPRWRKNGLANVQVAEALGNGQMEEDPAHNQQTQDRQNCDLVQERAEEVPPSWFNSYMEKLKREITDDISELISKRTVNRVLNSLRSRCYGATLSPPLACFTNPQPTEGGRASQVKESVPDDPVHEGIICDYCDQVISGVRYKCGNCSDFDLCEQCEGKELSHHPEHVFLKIRQPVLCAGLKKNGKMAPLLKNNIYIDNEIMEDGDKDRNTARLQEKMLHKEDKIQRKLKRKEEKMEEKIRRKEEKLKRHLEGSRDTPRKKEKLDLPQFRKELVDAEFVRDESIPDGTHVPPGTKLHKKWVVKNTGARAWSDQTQLKVMYGNMVPTQSEVNVPPLQPAEEGIVIAQLTAPLESGQYQSHWRLYEGGQRFGHRVWCSIVVDPPEILDVPGPLPPNVDLNMLSLEDTKQYKDKDIESAVNAVSQLKSPMQEVTTKVIDAELLTAHDLLSFEMLDIRERHTPKMSQTATPNNTPIIVSPPKSPIPEQQEDAELGPQQMSNNNSVEVVSEAELGGEAENRAEMTELVRERMASLGLEADADDIESWSSCCESISEVSDDDFYVVPIPDCFNPQLPASKCASTSVYVPKEDVGDKSVHEMLIRSHDLGREPLLKLACSTLSELSLALDPFRNVEPVEVVEEDKLPAVQVLGDGRDDSSDAKSVIHLEQEQFLHMEEAGSLSSSSDKNKNKAACQANRGASTFSMVVMETDSPASRMMTAERHRVPDDEEDVIIVRVQIPNEGVTNSIQMKRKDVKISAVEPVMTPDIPRPTDAPVDDEQVDEVHPSHSDIETEQIGKKVDPTSMDRPEELAVRLVSGAIGVASQMASSAFHTAKGVFHTLQANNQYVPPRSYWSPPKDSWEAPNEEWCPHTLEWSPPKEEWNAPGEKWTLPASQWEPPHSDWEPSHSTWAPPLAENGQQEEECAPLPQSPDMAPKSPMDLLLEMGFANREINERLLAKYQNDVDQALQELIDGTEPTWSNNRH